MFKQALWASLRILIFRAGPEDFPFDSGRRLLIACLIFSTACVAVFFSIIASPVSAILSAIVNIGLLAMATQLTLRANGLANRFQQTFNALLVTTGFLTLALVPMMIKVAPAMADLMKQAEVNPDIVNHPEQLTQLQAASGSFVLILILLFWQLLVIGYIFYKAAGSRALFILLGIFALMLILRGVLGGLMPG